MQTYEACVRRNCLFFSCVYFVLSQYKFRNKIVKMRIRKKIKCRFIFNQINSGQNYTPYKLKTWRVIYAMKQLRIVTGKTFAERFFNALSNGTVFN